MSLSETSVVNMALAKIGAKRINNLDTDSSVGAIHCRTHYEQTRDSLLRSHYWRFASARAVLSQDTNDPDFEWGSQFILPADFLRLKSVYADNGSAKDNTKFSFTIEDDRLLTDDSAASIRYIKRVTDTSKFDPLFTEILVLMLALKLVGPLAGGDPKLQDVIQRELRLAMPAVRALDRQETNTIGRWDRRTWNDARATNFGRIDSQLGSG